MPFGPPAASCRRTDSPVLFLFLVVVMPLFLGTSIYTLWRSKTLLVFTWYNWAGLESHVMAIRRGAAPFRHLLPGWFLYSLPDALWVFSFTALIEYIWTSHPLGLGRRLWILLPVCLSVGGEFGQLFHLIPGTFDWADVFAYLAAYLAASASVSTVLKVRTRQHLIGIQKNGKPA